MDKIRLNKANQKINEKFLIGEERYIEYTGAEPRISGLYKKEIYMGIGRNIDYNFSLKRKTYDIDTILKIEKNVNDIRELLLMGLDFVYVGGKQQNGFFNRKYVYIHQHKKHNIFLFSINDEAELKYEATMKKHEFYSLINAKYTDDLDFVEYNYIEKIDTELMIKMRELKLKRILKNKYNKYEKV
jgi:hypothetical protein